MSRPRVLVLSCLLASSLAAHAASSVPPDWPQFRGPATTGVSPATGVFEEPVGVGLSVAWRQPIGSGYSSVAVAGGRVVTMFTDGKQDIVAAFDARTGAELWRHETGPMYAGHDGSHDGPLSTPLIAGNRVVAFTSDGKLLALDATSGEIAWRVDTVEKYGAVQPFYGFSTSPLLVDDIVVLQIGAKEALVAGFRLDTGERVWAAGNDSVNYQNPTVIEQGGKKVLVAAGQSRLLGVDPSNGTVLWELEHEGRGGRGVNSLAPVPTGDHELFLALKDESSSLVRWSTGDDGVTFATVWETPAIRNSYNVPVYHDGFLYAFSSRFLTCVDAATGEARWRSREPGDGFLMLVDDHLVIVTKKGSVHVVRATPDGYHELGGVAVFDDLSWSPPSFAGGHVYVRSLGELARIDVAGGRTLATDDDLSGVLAGTKFGRLRDELAAAENKSALIDRFLAEQKEFPIVEGDVVTFVYRGPGTDLALAGDLIGARQERPMLRVEGTDLFYYAMRVPLDLRASYLFVRDFESIVDPLNPRTTKITIFDKDMEMSFSGDAIDISWFAMPAWPAPDYLEAAPARRGRIEQRKFDSSVIENRTISFDVYLPAGYDETHERFPVVYVHGGAAARRLGEWPIALDNLIGTRIAPVIVVFVQPSRAAPQLYVDMFATELVPLVDEFFRTIPEPSARASVGQGVTGPTALACAFGRPGVIGKVGVQSAIMLDSTWAQVQALLKPSDELPLDLYLDWGRYDLRNPHEAWDMGESNRVAVQALRDLGYQPMGGEVADGTGWPSWRNRTDRLLEALFPLN